MKRLPLGLTYSAATLIVGAVGLHCSGDGAGARVDANDAGFDGADAPTTDASFDVRDFGDEPIADVDLDSVDVSDFGLDGRPANDACLARPRPSLSLDVELREVFGAIGFDQPVGMYQPPGDSATWVMVERRGLLVSFPNREDAARSERVIFADLRDRVASFASEAGLLGLAFHPEYTENRRVFVSYTAGADGVLQSRLSRFLATEDGSGLITDSEVILIELEQPAGNHNGGHIAFGPDGLLYFALGDGGGGGDPFRHGQRTDTLFAAILRLDVDNEAAGRAYAIPADNPFVDGGGAAEVWAWGLRNPWRMSFDRETGLLWAGDVGQERREEINIIRGGRNYGWPVFEGASCYNDHPQCGSLEAEPPVVDYPHSEGKSVTGGYVYRGSAIGDLAGSYVFGDFVSGRIWRLIDDAEGNPTMDLIVDSGRSISSFAEGHDGELYVLDFMRGSVHRLTPSVDSVDTDDFPRLLSETGCVDATDPSRPGPGTIVYSVNRPFWSDGAAKERWFAIPDGTVASVDDAGNVVLPIGSVVVKQFRLGVRPIETRLMMRHDDGTWGGYTYRWNDDGRDATLLPAGRVEELLGQRWIFPSRGECMACHTEVAGRTLGFELDQLDGLALYPTTGRVANQLDTLASIGVIDGEYRASAPLPLPTADATASEHARAWMHTNCAFCHQPDGPGRADIDLRWSATSTGLCDELPRDDLGVDGARLVAPGDLERSVLFSRVARRGDGAMPPLGSSVVDPDGVALLEQWIIDGDCE